MGNIIEHAKRELKLAGYIPLEQEQEDDPNKWIQEDVLALLTLFEGQEHSGMSAPYCIALFKKLASFDILTPLTGKDEEWEQVEESLWQNSRYSAVFKGPEGAYCVSAVVFRDDKDFTFTTGRLEDEEGNYYKSRLNISKFPFTPKTFYVDVVEIEDDKYIVNREQWNEAIRYYSK